MPQTQVVRGIQTKKGRTALQYYRNKDGDLRQMNDCYRVTYRGTDVVTFDRFAKPDGTMMLRVLLNTGGWKSATTKLRMTQADNEFNLGCGVFQKNYDWYIVCKNRTIDFIGDAMLIIIREYDRFMMSAEPVTAVY